MAADLGTSDDPMSLLAEMGWDCPGAVQMSDPERVDQMLGRSGTLGHVTNGTDRPPARTSPRSERLLDRARRAPVVPASRRSSVSLTPDGWAEAKGSAPTHTRQTGDGDARTPGSRRTRHHECRGQVGVDVAASTSRPHCPTIGLPSTEASHLRSVGSGGSPTSTLGSARRPRPSAPPRPRPGR